MRIDPAWLAPTWFIDSDSDLVADRGSFDDLPLDRMLADFAAIYGDAFGVARRATSAESAGDDAFAG